MKSERVRARLSAYLEGDVSPREATRIEAALEASPDLREELRVLQATVSLLRGLPRPEAPPALTERVVARVRAGEADPVRWRDWLHRLFEPTFAVPLAAAVAALLVFLGTPPGGLPGGGPAPDTPIAAVTPPVPTLTPPVPTLTVARDTSGGTTLRVRTPNRLVLRMPRRQRLQMMRMLRGAGHPHSASLASQMEPDGDIVLASFSERRRRR